MLAVTDIDIEKINAAYIFKIFESMIGNTIKNVNLYESRDTGEYYFIVFFETNSSAKESYELLDGLEIEQTGIFLNLSFVPQDMSLDDPIEECKSSKQFKNKILTPVNPTFNDEMIELSDDNEVLFDIPDEVKAQFRKEEEKLALYRKEPVKKIENESSNAIKEAMKPDDSKNAMEGFEFNVADDRFQKVYENDDFILDASNKKFKVQKASMNILDERNKHKNQNKN